MRTTVTLDPDTAALVERVMAERGWTFKQAVNTAIRRGLTTSDDSDTEQERVRTPTFSMGVPGDRGLDVDLDRALALADELEDVEIRHELERGR
ncbi:MAG: hypothetical protein WD225_02485 [Ilumatobacteraceae bacterium]